MRQSSLLRLGKAETDVSVALNRLRRHIKHTTGREREMLLAAVEILDVARKELRKIQPL